MSEQVEKKIEEDDIQGPGGLVEQLDPHAAKWRTIGTNLGFRAGELDNIQSKQDVPVNYLTELLTQWYQWYKGDSWGTKNEPTLKALKNAVSRAGLGRVAAGLKLE